MTSTRTRLLRATEFVVGLVFGWGILIAGMADPAKVMAFLDVTGQWDPSLALVMGGAVLVGLVAFTWVNRRGTTLLGGTLHLPGTSVIDRRLMLGAGLFGAGWGLAGFCPGPGVVSMAAGEPMGALFVVAMLAGMALYAWSERRSAR